MRAIALVSVCLAGGYHGRRLEVSTSKSKEREVILDSWKALTKEAKLEVAFNPSALVSHHRSSDEWSQLQRRTPLPSMSQKISEEVAADRLIHQTTHLKKSDALLAVDNRAPCVILVRTQLDQNVGSVARAMLNFGLSDLRLVSPECDWLSDDARARASGADVVLEEAKHFDSVQEAVADLRTVYATTARVRRLTQHVMTPDLASQEIASSKHQAGILFGPEASGLTNEDLEIADSLIYIPTNPHFSSLNLAQAVNILGYATWQAQVKASAEEEQLEDELLLHAKSTDSPDLLPAKKVEVQMFLSRLETELDATSFTRDDDHRAHQYQLVRGMFNRMRLSAKDVRVLHGIVSALTGKKPPKPK
mmetsp:Transcript_126470/g.205496  ORF Transcript_126470/g.205496 Transcript_126470/m.205496 type:complete len:363 (+) Transcript_126470:57-1145(+)